MPPKVISNIVVAQSDPCMDPPASNFETALYAEVIWSEAQSRLDDNK